MRHKPLQACACLPSAHRADTQPAEAHTWPAPLPEGAEAMLHGLDEPQQFSVSSAYVATACVMGGACVSCTWWLAHDHTSHSRHGVQVAAAATALLKALESSMEPQSSRLTPSASATLALTLAAYSTGSLFSASLGL